MSSAQNSSTIATLLKIFFFCGIILLPNIVSAQIDREFWFAAPAIADASRSFGKPITLNVTTLAYAAKVVISQPANPAFTPITINVAANSTSTVDLTSRINDLENKPANSVLNKGLLISSTADITAYYEVVSSYCNCNPEIFSLKGKTALGLEFFISSQSIYNESAFYTEATNSFDIVATKNDTKVTITPKQAIVGHAANIPFTITLNAGQTYSATAEGRTASAHLQGSYVQADKPVAVTIKDDLVQVSSCADLVGDQTVPVNVLGQEYIVTRGLLQPSDNVFIMATEDGTAVYLDGASTALPILAKGQTASITLSAASTYIKANHRVYVYHLTGNGCEAGSAIIPKLNCTGSKSVSVVRSNGGTFAVMITLKNGNQGNFTVNGNTNVVRATDFTTVPGTGGVYVSARVDLTYSSLAGINQPISFANSTANFSLGLLNGGVDDGTRYGYFSDYKSTNVQSSLVETCPSTPTQLTAFGGVAYQWLPTTGLSNPTIANPMATVATTTDYTVLITTIDGCVDSAKVRVKPLETKVDNPVATICQGSSYTLPSGKVVNTTGTYTDVLKYKAGCDSLITNLTLTVVNNTPSLTITPSANNVCAGTSVTFTAATSNAGTSPTLQWQVNGVNVAASGLNYTSSKLNNDDRVTCTVTSNSTCTVQPTATSNVVIMVINPILNASVSIASSQNNICFGSIVNFNATSVNGGANPIYQWYVNGTARGSNSATFSADNFNNGDVVTCSINSNAMCAVPATATSNAIAMVVTTYSTPSVTIAASSNNVCQGTPITFTAQALNQGNPTIYQWRVNGVNTGTNSDTFISSSLNNGDAIICVIMVTGSCYVTPSASSSPIIAVVNPVQAPSISVTSSGNNICHGTPITFTANAINGGTAPAYQWMVNGRPSGSNSPTYTSSNFADNDVVTCQLTSNAPCAVPVNTTSNAVNITVNPSPLVDAGVDKTIDKGNSFQLNASATGAITDITWSPATGLSNVKTLTPIASPLSTTVYTLTIQSTNGCISTDQVKVTVMAQVVIPNTFTPNADGVNDKWEIKNLQDYADCTVQIFNRWGHKLYQSRGYSTPWDGTYNGHILSFGTYYYIINLNNGSSLLKGFVAIVQ